MKKTLIFLITAMAAAFTSQGVRAQFTIPSTAGPETIEVPLLDTSRIRLISPVKNDFFDLARYKAERRAIRKERNYLEISPTLQLSQTQFENWASGGDNTFAARTTLFVNHKYTRKKITLDSKLEARYGLNYIEKKRFKNEDEFKINLLGSWLIKDAWSYAASANFRSQFSTSYKSRDDRTRISTFMAPGFLELAVGFKYENKPLTLVLSPLSGNAVFVADDELSAQGINGVDPGKHSDWSIGPSIQANIDWEFAKVFRLRSSFYTFVNWNMEKRPVFRLETTLDIKATKFLTTTLYGFANYDRESNAAKPYNIQYKYSFAVGLAYTFKNK